MWFTQWVLGTKLTYFLFTYVHCINNLLVYTVGSWNELYFSLLLFFAAMEEAKLLQWEIGKSVRIERVNIKKIMKNFFKLAGIVPSTGTKLKKKQ